MTETWLVVIAKQLADILAGSKKVECEYSNFSIKTYKVGKLIRIDIIPKDETV